MKRELVVVGVLAAAFLVEVVATYPRLVDSSGSSGAPRASAPAAQASPAAKAPAVSVAAHPTTLPASDTPSAAAHTSMTPPLLIDDAGNSGRYAFHYGSGWEHVSGIDDGRTYGTSTRSMHPGSVASLTFVGTGIVVYGVLGPTGGRAYVTVDGAAASGIAHFYAPQKKVDRSVFVVDHLADGIHHLVILVAKPDPKRTSHRYVNIDGVGVTT